MFDNVRRLFSVPSRADRERAYLEQSVDQIDLELRQREIDRGLFRARRPYL
jgi:hypothetical protein